MTPEREQAVDYADRLTTNYECWCFSDVTRAAAVEAVSRALIASEAEKDRMRQALEQAPHWQRCKKLNCACKPDSLWERLVCPACPCDCYKVAALAETPPQPCTASLVTPEQEQKLKAAIDRNTAATSKAESDLGAKLTALHQEDSRKFRELLVEKQGEIDRLTSESEDRLKYGNEMEHRWDAAEDKLQKAYAALQRAKDAALSGSPADPTQKNSFRVTDPVEPTEAVPVRGKSALSRELWWCGNCGRGVGADNFHGNTDLDYLAGAWGFCPRCGLAVDWQSAGITKPADSAAAELPDSERREIATASLQRHGFADASKVGAGGNFILRCRRCKGTVLECKCTAKQMRDCAPGTAEKEGK